MNYLNKNLILLFCFILGLTIVPDFIFSEDLATTCQKITESNTGCPGINPEDCKVLLQKCYDYYDQQSNQLSQDITKTSQQKNTLANQIAILKKKIQNLDYQINQSTIKVKGLNVQIEDTQASINETSSKINDSQSQLANILRVIYEEDKKSSIEILIEGNLSDFFNNLVYLENLNSKISDLLENTKNLKSYLEEQKLKMDSEVEQLQKTIALQSLQKKESEQYQKEQQQYLNLTEAQYQQQLKEKQELEAKSAKIRSLLFKMVGITEIPTFGEALDVALSVNKLIPIRPAFLLAIISQESAIGRNVGQCVLTDPNTGDGKKVSTGAPAMRVMKPTRDVPIFLKLTTSLGRDPYNTPVSCWIPDYRNGVPYGWGGAMGPAQFIASTWCGAKPSNPTKCLFSDRLEKLLGQSADPWAIKDSFTAAALYLSDLGALKQTVNAEKCAACNYYGSCSSASCSSFYSKSVMNRAACIQSFIDSGTMSADCQKLIF